MPCEEGVNVAREVRVDLLRAAPDEALGLQDVHKRGVNDSEELVCEEALDEDLVRVASAHSDE